MKKKTRIELAALSGLALVASGLWYFNAFSQPASTHAAALVPAYKSMSVANPQIHWDRMNRARDTVYRSGGRDIFLRDIPPPPPPPAHVPQPGDGDYVAPPPPPPPPPPKLNLKFFGYGTVSNSTEKRAFLSDGELVYVVAEGDMVAGHFQITKINWMSLEFVDISSGRRGSAPLEESGP